MTQQTEHMTPNEFNIDPDKLYAVLPYGTLLIPAQLVETLLEHSFYVDKSYTSGSGYTYRLEKDKADPQVTFVKGQKLVADFVAQRLTEG